MNIAVCHQTSSQILVKICFCLLKTFFQKFHETLSLAVRLDTVACGDQVSNVCFLLVVECCRDERENIRVDFAILTKLSSQFLDTLFIKQIRCQDDVFVVIKVRQHQI